MSTRRAASSGRPISRRAPARAVLALGFFAALAALVPLATSSAGETWTLDRVLEAARTQDPLVQSARAGARAGRAEGSAALSALSPRLSFEGNALRTDDPATLFTQRLRQGRFTDADFALSQLNDPAARSALDAGLVLDVPLWNGGVEITAPAAASHQRRAADATADATVASHLLRAVETYVEAVQARASLAADSSAVAAAEESRRAAVVLFQRDQAPEADTLRVAARWGEARLGQLASENRWGTALERLSLLVGQRVDAEGLGDLPDVGESDLGATWAEGGDDSLSPGAGAARGELRAADEHARALDVEARRAGWRLLPSLNSRATLSYYRPWDEGEFEGRWTAGLSLSWPLWDGTRLLQERHAARSRADEAHAAHEGLRRRLAVEVEAARRERRVAGLSRDVARSARAAAEEGLRLASQRYRAELLPLGELLLAEAEAARARHNEVEAEGQVVLAHYRYLQAIGELR